ncbi:MAG: acyl-protein synthetase [Polyangiaceae bacterium]
MTSVDLHERVRRFIAAASPPEPFDDLAFALSAHQVARVPPVRRLFERAGLAVDALAGADAIPAVPTDAFRHRRIACHPPDEDVRVFATSGTTGGSEQRGRHPMRDLATYRLGALTWGRRMLFPDTDELATVALVADETVAPESSLSYMVARFAEILTGPASFHWDGERLDVDGVRRAVRSLEGSALVAGTSFAFVHLLDTLGDERLALPEGSRVMQTGGFKGRSRSVEAATLRRAIADRFGLDEAMVISEYGMTELGSQLYQTTLKSAVLGSPPAESPTAYAAPPWLRVRAVDPLTLAPVAPGEVGLARFVDLANVDSSVAIQTSERILVHEDGTLELLGRAPGATPRGCSLALEHLLDESP